MSAINRTTSPVDPNPSCQINGISTNVSMELSGQSINKTDQVAQQAFSNGVHAVLAFDPEHLEEHLSTKNQTGPTLIFSTKSGGQGFSRSVALTKKSDNKDDTERVFDTKRIKKQKKLFAEWKFSMTLTKDFHVKCLDLSTGLVILEHNGKFFGKYNMNDLGLFQPELTPHPRGGGILQLLRDVQSITDPQGKFQKPSEKELLKRADLHKELVGRIVANIKPETGGKLRGHYMTENKGNDAGHQALGTQKSDGAKKIIDNKKWMPSLELFQKFYHVEQNREQGKSDYFQLTQSGKSAFNDLCKVQELQKILEKNLASKIAEKEKEKKRFLLQQPNNLTGLQKITDDLNALIDAQNELKEIKPISVTFPIMLLNRRLSVKVHEMDAQGNYQRDSRGNLKEVKREIKGHKLLQPIPPEKYYLYGIKPHDHQRAAEIRNDYIEMFARTGEEVLGSFINEANTYRSFFTFWKKTSHVFPADAQVKTDMGGIVMQAASTPSSDPALNRSIQYAENHDTGNKVAKESRMADFLIHSVITTTKDFQDGIRGYNRAPKIVQKVFQDGLKQYQTKSAAISCIGESVSDSFTASAFLTGDGLFKDPQNDAVFKKRYLS